MFLLQYLSRATVLPNSREAFTLQMDWWATLTGLPSVACFGLYSTSESFWERASYIPGWTGPGSVAEDGLESGSSSTGFQFTRHKAPLCWAMHSYTEGHPRLLYSAHSSISFKNAIKYYLEVHWIHLYKLYPESGTILFYLTGWPLLVWNL